LISYGTSSLPSFCLPSDNINDLRLTHASCRKPHGGTEGKDLDALIILDSLLELNVATPLSRPQQLFLTGDQIYADDVADVLLFLLDDAGATLLNLTENLPGNPSNNDLLPGHRIGILKSANFTAGETAKSHLMRFSEYCSMYLFVWSDVLWPSNIPNDNTTIEGLPKYATDIFSPTPQDDYNDELNKIINFKSKLSLVRRALANIPVYMIFDDHDITDDWFINLEWTENTLGFGSISQNDLGSRIIQNGLTAYALFQGWGNTPDSFTPPIGTQNHPGWDLLNKVGTLANNHGNNIADWNNIKNLILPTLTSGPDSIIFISSNFIWYYDISFEKYKVIVLDTRTNRAFPSGTKLSPPSLIYSQTMDNQLTLAYATNGPNSEFVLIVSPAPVFGHDFIETIGQPLKAGLENIYKSGNLEEDLEAWSFNEYGFQKLLDVISKFNKVVILSGDVHYGFSARVKYWNDRLVASGGIETRATFAQLVASSLKNQTHGTDWAASTLTSSFIFDAISEYVGWENQAKNGLHYKIFDPSLGIYLQIRSEESPDILRYNSPKFLLNSPNTLDWSYRIEFISDLRNDSDRGTQNGASFSIQSPSNINPRVQIAYKHTLREFSEYRMMVGCNNLAVINFDWDNSIGKNHVIQRFWYYPGDNPLQHLPLIQPYTEHIINLSLPSSSENKPGQ
jgi:hypothetical protein